MRFSFSDEDFGSIDELLTALYQHLRSIADLPRPLPYLFRETGAFEQMRADISGKVGSALRAEVRASAHGISRQLNHAELQAAGDAFRDDVVGTKNEEQRALFIGQPLGAGAVQVR